MHIGAYSYSYQDFHKKENFLTSCFFKKKSQTSIYEEKYNISRVYWPFNVMCFATKVLYGKKVIKYMEKMLLRLKDTLCMFLLT